MVAGVFEAGPIVARMRVRLIGEERLISDVRAQTPPRRTTVVAPPRRHLNGVRHHRNARSAAARRRPSASHPATARGPDLLLGVQLPAISLALTLGFWYQTRQDIETLATAQRQLAADLDAARGASTIDVTGAPALGPSVRS